MTLAVTMPGRSTLRRGRLLILCVFVAGAMVRVDAHAELRLISAVRNRDLEAVRLLLKEGVDVNVRQADGAVALHWAAHWDDVPAAKLLIAAGARPEAANDLGVTPLYLACRYGSASMVRLLLGAGANPNARGPSAATCLMMAARAGNITAVQALLAHGADVNAKEQLRGQTALMWAAAQQHAAVVKALLDAGADVDARTAAVPLIRNVGYPPGISASRTAPTRPLVTVREVPKGGSTALFFAARHGDIESAKLLVARGADVNAVAADGAAVLAVAARSGQGEFAAWLLDQGANPDADGSGHTALHAAVLRGDRDLVKALLAHGANADARLTKGTPARRSGADFVLPEFLAGATPFYLAATYLEIDIMRLLVAHGADPRATILDGTTPLMAAAGYDWRVGLGGKDRRFRVQLLSSVVRARLQEDERSRAIEAVRLALELGNDVNSQNTSYGDTALSGASTPEVQQLLLEAGAQPDLAENNR